jgi:hypothetical protein
MCKSGSSTESDARVIELVGQNRALILCCCAKKMKNQKGAFHSSQVIRPNLEMAEVRMAAAYCRKKGRTIPPCIA